MVFICFALCKKTCRNQTAPCHIPVEHPVEVSLIFKLSFSYYDDFNQLGLA